MACAKTSVLFCFFFVLHSIILLFIIRRLIRFAYCFLNRIPAATRFYHRSCCSRATINSRYREVRLGTYYQLINSPFFTHCARVFLLFYYYLIVPVCLYNVFYQIIRGVRLFDVCTCNARGQAPTYNVCVCSVMMQFFFRDSGATREVSGLQV